MHKIKLIILIIILSLKIIKQCFIDLVLNVIVFFFVIFSSLPNNMNKSAMFLYPEEIRIERLYMYYQNKWIKV